MDMSPARMISLGDAPAQRDRAIRRKYRQKQRRSLADPGDDADAAAAPAQNGDRFVRVDITNTTRSDPGIPSWLFDRDFYIDKYSDIRAICAQQPGYAVENHFWTYGANEGRMPSLYVDPPHVARLLAYHAGVRLGGAEAIRAFFDLPESDRFVPNGWFNGWAYRHLYRQHFSSITSLVPDISTLSDYQLFVFYVENAFAQRVAPNGLFNESLYRASHPAIAEQIAEGRLSHGFMHFATCNPPQPGTLPDFVPDHPAQDKAVSEQEAVLSGRVDLGANLWWFDEILYLSVYPDVHELKRKRVIRNGLEHFLVLGHREGRVPHAALGALASGQAEPDLASELARLRPAVPAPLDLAHAASLAAILRQQPFAAAPAMIDAAVWRAVAPAPIDCAFDSVGYLNANPDLLGRVGVDAARDHWRRHGLREQRLIPGTNLFGNRRLHLEDLGRYQIGGVNLIGPLQARSGLGAATRGYRDALRAAGVQVDAYDASGASQPGAGFDLFDPAKLRYGHNLICLNPDQIMILLDRYGSALFDRRVNIGAWVWEAPVARPEWDAVLGAFDLIITPSLFCRDAFTAVTARPIETVPYVVDRAGMLEAAAQAGSAAWMAEIAAARAKGRRGGRIVVLFIMDASSSTARKGADIFRAVAAAMTREAPHDFLFVLKTHSRDQAVDPIEESTPGMIIIDAKLDQPELVALKLMADIYLSPHRSEGFGLNIFESLALGVPALLSDYAGARELLGDDYPLQIPGQLCEVGDEHGPYRAHTIWFEPDQSAIIKMLRGFARNPQKIRAALRDTCQRIAAALSMQAVGAQFRQLLENRCAFGLDVARFVPAIAAPRDEYLALPGAEQSLAEPAARLSISATLVHPDFSVITPTYNTRADWLDDLYADLTAQDCQSWEWCIVDDGSTDPATLETLRNLRRADSRIRIMFSSENLGISASTNRAVTLSSAPYLVMVDHDDRLAPSLLSSYRTRIAASSLCDLLYCDENKLRDDGSLCDHFFKPDFAPEHLMSVMYVLHCLCIRKSTFLELGGYRSGFDGAQDHDFALRAASADKRFQHVPGALYHWRMVQGSTAASLAAKPASRQAGLRAVTEHLQRIGVTGRVEPGCFTGSYRVRPNLPREPVSLLVLTGFGSGSIGIASKRKRICYVERFIDSILATDGGADFELTLVVDEGNEIAAEPYLQIDRRISMQVHRRQGGPFNFAAKANFAVRTAKHDRVVLLNDDMEVIGPGWLAAILEPLELPGVGIVGGKLLYPDNTVQHAGIVLGLHGAAGHVFIGTEDQAIGYNGFTHIIRNYAAVTGAFMAFRRCLFDRIGGFDEQFPIDYNDVDFCLRARELGKRVVYTPFARLRHYESRSAPRDAVDAIDTARFTDRWRAIIGQDPFYNPHLSRQSSLYEAIQT